MFVREGKKGIPIPPIGSVSQILENFYLDYGKFACSHNEASESEEFFKKVQESSLMDITLGSSWMVDRGKQSHRRRVNQEKPVRPARELIA